MRILPLAALLCLAACGEPATDEALRLDGAIGRAGPAGFESDYVNADGSSASWADLESPVAVAYLTATWCFTCGPETRWLEQQLSGPDPLSAVAIVVEGNTFETATAADAQAFSDRYQREQLLVWADTHGALDGYRGGVIPYNLLFCTRDWTLVEAFAGFSEARMQAAINHAREVCP